LWPVLAIALEFFRESKMVIRKTFSLRVYVKTIAGLLMSPRGFFAETENLTGIWSPMAFLFVSSFLFTAASAVSVGPDRPLWVSAVLFVNAVGMVWIAAALGWMVMVLTVNRKASFGKLFGIYAFSSGLTLLASWVPFFLVLTEPWKWWLIGVGLAQRFHLRWHQVAWVLGLSLVILILLFWSAFPLVSVLRNG
jgi:hypothetical protein